MGVCLQIRNQESGERFALKGIQKSHLIDKNSYRRYINELEVWNAASSCDGVVEAKGLVQINSLPYMISEWISGGDLSKKLHWMSSTDKVRAFFEIVASLQMVYDKFKIIHRDLKPQNILMTTDSRALISDWGLAKIYGDALIQEMGDGKSSQKTSSLTIAGSCLGTVLYMSPEQIQNAAGVDFRSDIYSLGCMLYEFETGKPPFVAGKLEDILAGHLYLEPPKLGGPLKRTKLGLESVIAKCLQKKPSMRYQSYQELMDDLKHHLRFRGIPTYRIPKMRYKRELAGKAFASLQADVHQKADKDGHAVIGGDVALRALEEAEMYLGTNRPAKAVEVLKVFAANAELIASESNWNFACSLILNYAYALAQDKQVPEALHYFRLLERTTNKPVEFYLDYSLAKLMSHDWMDAIKICEEGIMRYPSESGLYGNLTTAHVALSDFENALSAIHQAIEQGGIDVHRCEEMNMVHALQCKKRHYSNLDEWEELMRERYRWIQRGLEMNPMFSTLRLAEMQLISEVDFGSAILKCKELMNDPSMAGYRQQLTFKWATYLKEWSRSKPPNIQKNSLDALKSHVNDKQLDDETRLHVRDTYFFLLMNTFGLYVNPHPAYFQDIVDYYLHGAHSKNESGAYRCPIEAAQILADVGKHVEACNLLKPLAEKGDWYAQRIYTMILMDGGDIRVALQIAQKGVSEMPESCETWDTYAHVCEVAGMTEAALSAKKQADMLFAKEMKIKSELARTMGLPTH
jgi:tetratricopeptide (TPR) repeat protein